MHIKDGLQVDMGLGWYFVYFELVYDTVGLVGFNGEKRY